MKKNIGLAGTFALLFLVLLCPFVFAQSLDIDVLEDVSQEVVYNQENGETQNNYNVTGKVTISNKNPNGETLSDIYISFNDSDNLISNFVKESGRDGSIISEQASGIVVLNIPQLQGSETSVWTYIVNNSKVNPPINLTSNYSKVKTFVGGEVSITDTIQNNYAGGFCVDDILLVQNAASISQDGVISKTTFNGIVSGNDSLNVAYNTLNTVQTWNVSNGDCIIENSSYSISYNLTVFDTISGTGNYNISKTFLTYNFSSPLSGFSVIDVSAVGDSDLGFDKKVVGISEDNSSYFVWNITGHFKTDSTINYTLNSATFWVSNSTIDLNYVDTDKVSGSTLQRDLIINQFVNSSFPWNSSPWSFNYTDTPSPVVWFDVDFSIASSEVKKVNRTIIQGETDIYIKELYIILGYFLEIEKNITPVGEDKYSIRIDVKNKGNQVTPVGSPVTIYDFVPENFTVDGGNFLFSTSSFYNTRNTSNAVSGNYNGTLYQWALIANNSANSSFDIGSVPSNESNSWSVEFNVTGSGEYDVLDVFITGLDPQHVEGAGASKAVIVSEVINKLRSTEGIFAGVAVVLLLLGLLL